MTKNKTEFTPSEALECLEDVSKNALYNDMNNGVLSYEEKQWGKKTRRVIQGVELARIYQDKFKPQNTNGTTQENETKQGETLQENIKTTSENNVLQREIEILKEQLRSKTELLNEVKNSRDDLSKKLDSAQQTLQSQTLLLEDHRNREGELKEELEQATQQPVERPKGFWSRLVGA